MCIAQGRVGAQPYSTIRSHCPRDLSYSSPSPVASLEFYKHFISASVNGIRFSQPYPRKPFSNHKPCWMVTAEKKQDASLLRGSNDGGTSATGYSMMPLSYVEVGRCGHLQIVNPDLAPPARVDLMPFDSWASQGLSCTRRDPRPS